MMIIIVD